MRTSSLVMSSLLLVALPGLASAGKAADAALELRSSTETVWVDTPARLELVLTGRAVTQVVAGTPGLQGPVDKNPFMPPQPDSFVMRFHVLPKKPGKLVLGPYSLTFGGRKLRSNRLVLQVLKTPDVPSALQLTVDPAAIDLGQTFRLHLTANDKRSHQAKLKTSERYTIKSRSTSMNYSINAGRKSEQHVRIFEIQPAKPGKLTLGRTDLEDLPPGVKIEAVTVQVR